MVKRCAWGTYNSDTRFPRDWATVCISLPFPKPLINRDKCLLWIKLCDICVHICTGRKRRDETIISRLRFGHTGLNSNLFKIGKHRQM